jgi:hypothetical protein
MTALASARGCEPDPNAERDPVRRLLEQARRLTLDWRDQRKFYEDRSELLDGLRQLFAAGVPAAAPISTPPASPPAPAPALPLPRLPPRMPPVSSAGPLTLTLPPDRFALLVDLATAPNPRAAGFSVTFRPLARGDRRAGPYHSARRQGRALDPETDH